MEMEKLFENEVLEIYFDDDAFVVFKGIEPNEIGNHYRADAEIAVQEFLDSDECPEYYKNATAGVSAVYVSESEDEFGITVRLNY